MIPRRIHTILETNTFETKSNHQSKCGTTFSRALDYKETPDVQAWLRTSLRIQRRYKETCWRSLHIVQRRRDVA